MKSVKSSLLICMFFLLSGCATLGHNFQAPQLNLVDLKMLSSTGFEQQFEVKLRIQNPNSVALPVKGMSYDIYLLGDKFASGVSNNVMKLGAYSEQLVTFNVSTNLLQAGQSLLKLFRSNQSVIDYSLNAKIDTGNFLLGRVPVTKSGKVELKNLVR